jgi:hypothetical protein
MQCENQHSTAEKRVPPIITGEKLPLKLPLQKKGVSTYWGMMGPRRTGELEATEEVAAISSKEQSFIAA